MSTLVERLRQFNPPHYSIEQEAANRIEILEADLRKAVESYRVSKAIRDELEAERDALKAEVDRLTKAHEDVIAFVSQDDRMDAWDKWRAAIAKGDTGSWPRDQYEATLCYVYDIAFSAINGVNGPPVARAALAEPTRKPE